MRDCEGGKAEMTAGGSAHRPDPAGAPRYLPIAEHGLIGDLRTAALVGTDGTIDWYCCPRFDSPSVFASILDADRGGSFELAADVPARTKQFYFPDTNVLITRFFADDGVGEIQDFMPIVDGSREADRHRLIRRVLCVRGSLPFRARVAPRFDYGAQPHTVRSQDGAARLRVAVALPGADRHACRSRSTARTCGRSSSSSEGESAVFALDQVGDGAAPRGVPARRGRGAVRRDRARTGGAGCPRRATAAGGGRWCTAPR